MKSRPNDSYRATRRNRARKLSLRWRDLHRSTFRGQVQVMLFYDHDR